MSEFDKVLGTKDNDEEITDPKLLKYLKKEKGSTVSGKPPDLTKLKDEVHRPDRSISLVFDGVPERPAPEVMERYKCNKCGKEFSHTHQKIVAGIMPRCPKCD